MSLVYGATGFVLGFVVGIGAALFFLRWRMKRQLGNLEEQMSALEDMGDAFGEMDFEEDVDAEE